LKHFNDFYLKAKASIWPWLSDVTVLCVLALTVLSGIDCLLCAEAGEATVLNVPHSLDGGSRIGVPRS
jgi:hypothetical protein